jgi:hypothetical protein
MSTPDDTAFDDDVDDSEYSLLFPEEEPEDEDGDCGPVPAAKDGTLAL